MYSSLENIQILISLLKKYGIKNLVVSPGGRSTPFIHSVEQDSYFKLYTIVDERSASFFALGLVQKLKIPVAVCSSSGTACANYYSAVCEAFYQQLPLLTISADRNHQYLYQQEEQMIPQENSFIGVSKKNITLGHVRDEKDFWYNSRICNEALLELTTGIKGPVHINYVVEDNYPIIQGIVKFEQENLPDVKKISKLTLEDNIYVWKEWGNKLKKSKILIIYGQAQVPTEDEINIIEDFANKYNCIISTDSLSNLHCKFCLPTFTLCRSLNQEKISSLIPDIVITMNGNSVTEIKNRLLPFKNSFEHWHVSATGDVSDPLKMLSDIISCTPVTFFRKFAELNDENDVKHTYFDDWKNEYKKIGQNGNLNAIELDYSAMYATQQFIKSIPDNSLLHIANSNSIRLSNYFTLKNNIEVYCNRGTNGIDGSMSSFIGQAHISQKPSYLIIGDLSFFYDMNALWNNYVGKNIRIMVVNNSGGAFFYTFPSKEIVPTVGEHIAAEHKTSVKDWVISRGFTYLTASNKTDLDRAISEFNIQDSDKPILLEVFTNKENDAKAIKDILNCI